MAGPGASISSRAFAGGGAPAIQFPQTFFLVDATGQPPRLRNQRGGQRVRNVRTADRRRRALRRSRADGLPTGAASAGAKPTPAQAAQYIKCTLEGVG